MTLADLIAQLGRFDDALSIYAVPRWRASSEARVLAEPFDGTHPQGAEGMTYLATVAEARRAVAAYRRVRPGANAGQICASVVYYAIYDALEPCSPDEPADEGREGVELPDLAIAV
jgi:hypothetical protein